MRQSIGYLVPLYVSGLPPYQPDPVRCENLLNLKKKYPRVPFTIIIDGSAGEGSLNANWLSYINQFRAEKILCIGYIGLCTGKRTLVGPNDPSITSPTCLPWTLGTEQQIDRFASYYRLDGIFFDECQYVAGEAVGSPGQSVPEYYQAAGDYGKSKYGYTMIMDNVGSVVPELLNVASVLSIEDQSGALPSASNVYSRTTQIGGNAKKFALIIGGGGAGKVTSAPSVQYLKSIRNFISWIWVTDQPNDSLDPSYQNETVANLAELYW